MVVSKKYISAYTVSIWLMLVLVQSSCSTSKIDIDMVKNSKGWIDHDTYAIIAIGRPVRSHISVRKLKDSARRAAIINARFKILKRFKALGRKKSSKTDVPQTRIQQAMVIKKIIKKGKVVFEQFDRRYNCEIIYQIQHKGLKDLVKQTDLSGLDIIN